MRSMMHLVFFSAVALLLPAAAIAQKNSPPSDAEQASLPHDTHSGITVSAKPVTDSERAKHIFGKANPIPSGVLPVEVFLRNDTGSPVQIGLDTIQLEIHYQDGRMDGVDSLPPAQAAKVIAHPNGPAAPREPRFPIGVGPIGDKKTRQFLELLQPLALTSGTIPPMSAIHGYLFFDLQHQMSLVNQSSLYIPDAMVLPSKTPLIFFEVSFATP